MKTSRIILGCILASSGFLAGGAGAQVVTEFSAGITACKTVSKSGTPLGSPVTLSGGGIAQVITPMLTQGIYGITAV
jgi:hypothetical protein